MSVKSVIFNSLFTTGQKINIAVSRSLIDFYSNIRALAMLSRCSLELSMGVFTYGHCELTFKLTIPKTDNVAYDTSELSFQLT